MDIMERTLKNTALTRLSIIKYDQLIAFYFSKVMLKLSLTRKSSIAFIRESKLKYLLGR